LVLEGGIQVAGFGTMKGLRHVAIAIAHFEKDARAELVLCACRHQV